MNTCDVVARPLRTKTEVLPVGTVDRRGCVSRRGAKAHAQMTCYTQLARLAAREALPGNNGTYAPRPSTLRSAWSSKNPSRHHWPQSLHR